MHTHREREREREAKKRGLLCITVNGGEELFYHFFFFPADVAVGRLPTPLG